MSAALSPRCRFCGTALDALSLRRGSRRCDAPACRVKAEQALQARVRDVLSQALRDTLPAEQRDPLVVWLQPHDPQAVPLSAARRAAHRAHLDQVLTEGLVIDQSRLPATAADDSHPQGPRLCGQCRGRCCRHGAVWNAFIDHPLFERWHAAHPGAAPQAVVEAYMAWLPDTHVENGCVYQTAQGCSVPREARADVCNGFACDALVAVQRSAADRPGRPVLAVTLDARGIARAALITAHRTTPLPAPALAAIPLEP